MGDLLGEQWVLWKLIPQRNQQSASPRFVFLPHVSNCQQDAGERGQIVAAFRGQLQFSNSLLLITRDATQANQPAYRGGHAADNILAYACSQVSVIAFP